MLKQVTISKRFRIGTGFTLVELLVVVAIIALLISILIPTLSSARNQSKLTVCQANLRSIGQLIQIYAEKNENRIARGPSHFIQTPNGGFPGQYDLTNPFIATNMLWIGYGFQDTTNVQRPAQYVGLGMLTQKPGKAGNEMFYCPADDQNDLTEETPKLGQVTVDAYSSYLYRQLDMLPPDVSGEYTPPPQRQGPAKIDDMRFNTDPARTYKVEAHAMALDMNVYGEGDLRRTNHTAQRVNVLYNEGSVNSFENNPQPNPNATATGGETPWAGITGEAFAVGVTPPMGIMDELDRILVAADYGFLSPEPWRAPKPPYPPY